MNWTGGRLQRHSNSKGGAATAARQRQHFGKVHQNIRAGQNKKNSPIKLSIFNHVVEDRNWSRRGSSGVKSHQSDRSRSLQHGGLHHIPDLSASREIGSGSQIQQYRDELPTPVKRPASPVSEDDLYNATPPPRPPRIKREELLQIRELDDFEKLDESLSDKRRRLLRRGDWVGVGIQKPVGIKFVTSMVDENVGRRKKLTDGHRARYQPRQSHIASPFAHKRKKPNSPFMGEPHRLQQNTDVRISIGGKVVPPGVSSSSVGGRGVSELVDSDRRSFTQSSDMMLLDGGGGVTTHNSKNYRQIILDHQPRKRGNIQTPFSRREIEAVMQDTSSPTQRNSTKNRLLRTKNESFESSEYESGSNEGQRKDLESLSKEDGKTKLSYDSEVVCVISSCPSIHQPIPCSSKVSKLLQSDSRRQNSSTIAQVGEIPRVISRSQEWENDIWATWVALSSEIDENGVIYGTDYDQETRKSASISPGISTIFAAREMARINSKEVLSSPLDSPALVDEETVSAGLEFPKNRLEAYNEGLPNRNSEKTGPAKVSTAFQKFQSTGYSNIRISTPRELQQDTDEIWRKFVFGDGSDEIEATELSQQAEQVKDQPSRSTNFSTMGHAGTGSSPSTRGLNGVISALLKPQWSRSSGYIRNTEDAPVTTSSISLKSKQRQAMKQTTWEEDHESKGSYATFGSSVATSGSCGASPVASVVAQASSSSCGKASIPGLFDSGAQGKVIFTKPKPFTGRNSDPTREGKQLHIGRTLRNGMENFEMIEGERKGRRDIYDLYGSEEEIESVEEG